MRDLRVSIETVSNGYVARASSYMTDGKVVVYVFESLDHLLDWLRKHFTDEPSTEKVEPGVTVRRAS